MGDPENELKKKILSAIRAESRGVALKPVPRAEQPQPVCLPPQKDSISSLESGGEERKKIVCRSKLLRSDYAHEIFIISRRGDFYSDGTHQAQLDQIMKMHPQCQSTAAQRAWERLAPSRLGLHKIKC